jgi:hypothetical protein
MASDKRGGSLAAVLAVALCGAVAARFLQRAPQVHAPRKPAAPYVHPVVPSTPVVHPAPPSCRVRDLRGAIATIRQVDPGAFRACNQQAAEKAATAARIDMLAAAVSGCVARDAELDSQWNSVQAAVLELRACASCAKDVGMHCARVIDLLTVAERDLPEEAH